MNRVDDVPRLFGADPLEFGSDVCLGASFPPRTAGFGGEDGRSLEELDQYGAAACAPVVVTNVGVLGSDIADVVAIASWASAEHRQIGIEKHSGFRRVGFEMVGGGLNHRTDGVDTITPPSEATEVASGESRAGTFVRPRR